MGQTRDDISISRISGQVGHNPFCGLTICLREIISLFLIVVFFLFVRFQGQTQLHKSKPSDFREAIEEAFLAENGFFDTNNGSGQLSRTEENLVGVEEATGSNQDQESHSQNQASSHNSIFLNFYSSFLQFQYMQMKDFI